MPLASKQIQQNAESYVVVKGLKNFFSKISASYSESRYPIQEEDAGRFTLFCFVLSMAEGWHNQFKVERDV